jgi:hypothetical protein
LDKSNIKEYPEGLEKYFVSDLQIRSSDNSIVLYVPKDKVSEMSKKGHVSPRQLRHLMEKLEKKYDTKVHLVYLKSRKIETLESGVFELLNHRFGGVIEQLYLKCNYASEISAWIFVDEFSDSLRNEIEVVFKKLITESSFTLGSVQWNDAKIDFPTVFNILVATKNLQPATLEEIIEHFKEDFTEIPEKWLNRQYDKLLKKGLVLREHNFKSYSLTSNGLGVVPNPPNRYSSDITRALALGKRKW